MNEQAEAVQSGTFRISKAWFGGVIVGALGMLIVSALVSISLANTPLGNRTGSLRAASAPEALGPTIGMQGLQRVIVEVVVATPAPVVGAPQAAVGSAGSPSQPAPQLPEPTQLPDAQVADTLAGARDFARLGQADAPVTIVIFEDPQCPFCKQMVNGSEQALIKAYVDTGKASLIYRHMAFLGSDSLKIATAMECAGQQDKFWPFHKIVYERQLPENSGLADDSTLATWAKDAGLDGDQYAACVKDGKALEVVQADTAAARTLGVQGTPTMFINGRRLVGALPIDMLTSTVDYELAQTSSGAPALP